MKRSFADWLWRIAMLGVAVWIAIELKHIHLDLIAPAEDPGSTAASEPDDLQGSVDGLRDDVVVLTQKVDAMMQAMIQLKP